MSGSRFDPNRKRGNAVANEITLTASLSCYKPAVMSSAIGRSVTNLLFNMSGNLYTQDTMSVATSATVIPLGAVTAPHWAFFNNLDPTNFIKIRNGSGGADLIKLKPGECCFVPLLDTATPYAIADTGACLMEYLIISL